MKYEHLRTLSNDIFPSAREIPNEEKRLAKSTINEIPSDSITPQQDEIQTQRKKFESEKVHQFSISNKNQVVTQVHEQKRMISSPRQSKPKIKEPEREPEPEPW